jgi:hypothetical protein
LDQWLIEIKSLNILIKKKLKLSPEQHGQGKEEDTEELVPCALIISVPTPSSFIMERDRGQLSISFN